MQPEGGLGCLWSMGGNSRLGVWGFGMLWLPVWVACWGMCAPWITWLVLELCAQPGV